MENYFKQIVWKISRKLLTVDSIKLFLNSYCIDRSWKSPELRVRVRINSVRKSLRFKGSAGGID